MNFIKDEDSEKFYDMLTNSYLNYIRNEKLKTTDEFLVKKRNPLVLPPNYEEVPKPGTMPAKNENEADKIKKILKAPEADTIGNNKSKSVEESILKRIRK